MEVIYYDEVPMGQVVECGYHRSFEGEVCQDKEDKEVINHIYHCANTVCTALLDHNIRMLWPPYSTDLKQVNVALPPVDYNLLA